MHKNRVFYTENFPIFTRVATKDQAPPQRRDPKMEAKLSRIVALLEKLAAEDRPAVTDVMSAKKRQRRENARRLRDRDTDSMKFLQDAIRQAAYEAACEGAQAAYASRNPHKAQRDEPQETRVQYPHKPRQREPWENRVRYAQDSARYEKLCRDSESAYAARNPHKRK